jgi:alcohol dehydrogenase (cytochrome c)
MIRILLLLFLTSASQYLTAQVTYQRLLHADSEPGNWLTYSGSYRSWRYSALDQINRQNAGSLKVAWVHQMPTSHRIETTPIVADGVMYVSEPPSNVFALDAATGRPTGITSEIFPPGSTCAATQSTAAWQCLATACFSVRWMRTWSR